MIGRLRGFVISKSDGVLLIDVAGVGYVVHCSARTLAELPDIGEEAIIHTELVVREDLMQLYGFASISEREWYGLLTSVQGVGAKVALAILGSLTLNTLSRALTIGDVNVIRSAPGIGPKLAQRICHELKDKAAKLMSRTDTSPSYPPQLKRGHQEFEILEEKSGPNFSQEFSQEVKPDFTADAISALVNLGYDRTLAAMTIATISDEAQDLNTLIKAALRAMAPRE